MLADLLDSANPSIGIYARRDGVHVRLSAKAATREEAWRLIDPLGDRVRGILGRFVWGEDEDTLAAGVGRLLRDRGLTLAVMESATGGAIANAITDVAGSSDYFRGSLVTYATEAKIAHGVPAEVPAMHGVISRETAEAMAAAAREQLGADLGLGLTGIAGGDEIEGQPPGARCTSRSRTASAWSTRHTPTTRAATPPSAAPPRSRWTSCGAGCWRSEAQTGGRRSSLLLDYGCA